LKIRGGFIKYNKVGNIESYRIFRMREILWRIIVRAR